MSYSAIAVANALLTHAQATRLRITPTRLQLLLYLVQSYHLKTQRSPLFDDFFVRSSGGPRIPSIHHKVWAYDGLAIDRLIPTLGSDPDVRNIPHIPATDKLSWRLIRELLLNYGAVPEAELLIWIVGVGSAWERSKADEVFTLATICADAARLFNPGG